MTKSVEEYSADVNGLRLFVVLDQTDVWSASVYCLGDERWVAKDVSVQAEGNIRESAEEKALAIAAHELQISADELKPEWKSSGPSPR